MYYIKRHISLPTSLEIGDAINIGMIGLINALDSYDVSKKYKFITYAHWWIRKELYESIYPSLSIIGIPISQIRAVRDLEHMKIERENAGEPSGWPDVIKEFFDCGPAAAKKIERTINATIKAMNVFLDSELPSTPDGDGHELHDNFIERIPSNESPEANESHIGACSDVKGYLGALGQREKDVVCMHFGIDNQPYTYREIGRNFAFTGERARQIVNESIKKIREEEGIE